MKEVAYEDLRTAISSSAISAGSSLVERDLAERYGLSRTLIRDILGRLDHDGLIERIPNRGAFVRRLTPNEIVDVFYAREAVEGMAAHLAAERHDPLQLATVETELRRARARKRSENLEALFQASHHLHDFIVEASKSKPLQRAYTSLRSEATLIRALTQSEAIVRSPTASVIQIEIASYHDHLTIIEALKTRDGPAAEKAMRSHLSATRERLFKHLIGNSTTDANPRQHRHE